MKILVTGGNGFLGKPIVEFLVKENHEVVVLDIGTENLKLHPKLRIIKGGFEDKEKTAEATFGVDAVYHLALNFCNDLTEFFLSNIKGTINILESAAVNKVRHLLYCSSSAVYGSKAPSFVVDETYPASPENINLSKMPPGMPKGAKLGYGILKLTLEKLCLAFGENNNLPITILRVIGGFGGKHNGVKPPGYSFIRQALTNQAIEIKKGEKITTAWVYDTAQAFLLATQNPKAFGEIFNVFSFPVPKGKIATFIVEAMHSKSKIKIVSGKERVWEYDQTKIQTLLGFKPKAKPERLKNCLKDYIVAIKENGK